MKKDNFIVECEESLPYINDLKLKLKQESDRILNFFELQELKKAKIIKIWTNKEAYQQYLEHYVDTYYDWMCADTYDVNINLLSIEECKKTEAHKNMTLKEMLENITHEFVHACQQEINKDSKNVEWFWEALATNLANPFDHVASMQCEDEELINNFNATPFAYEICYTIGKYLLENYSKEQILEYVKQPEKLRKEAKTIFAAEKIWFNKQYLPLSKIIENKDFVIYGTSDISAISKDILDLITNKKEKILQQFKLDSFRKIQINLFDNQDIFVKFIKSLRWQGTTIPQYCKGTYDNYMVNFCIADMDVKLKISTLSSKIIHECIHIIYNSLSDQRIIWLDEGLAMNLSGEMNDLLDKEALINLIETRIKPMKFPKDLNDLIHGSKFVNDDYNGYPLSYLSVRYLLETKTDEELLQMIKFSEKAKELGPEILSKAINYYQQ